jgi:hypothetical protein
MVVPWRKSNLDLDQNWDSALRQRVVMARVTAEKVKAGIAGGVATAILGALIVIGSRNLNHFDRLRHDRRPGARQAGVLRRD